MRPAAIFGFLFATLDLVIPTGAADPTPPAKHLIEFGWDEPDTAFMHRHLDQLERSPFDGCVFHVEYHRPGGKSGNFTWDGWGRQAFTEADLQPAVENLKTTPFRRFKHNFLRFNTTPADLDWFDDNSAVVGNARLAAHVAKEGRCRGVLFDIEQYGGPLFNYAKQKDRQSKSWSDYAAQARRRGREVMGAFQEGYPDLVVFLTFGYCLPWEQSNGGKKPLAECDYGLLAPFLDGLFEAAAGRTRIVDGCELAYGYREAKHFTDARRRITNDLIPMVGPAEKYRRAVSVSFGLWMDYDWRKQGWNVEEVTRNVLPPEKFEAVVRSALLSADEYVWIYTETPRWWSAEGKPVKLPPAYDAAVRRAKDSVLPRKLSDTIYQVRYLPSAEIKLDGQADEAAWSKANVERGFTFPWTKTRAPATEFRALCDDTNLYFSFRVRDADVMALDKLQDEQDVALEDRVEMFFSRDDQMKEYYCVEIDSRGRVLDYRGAYYRQFDRKWNWTGLEVKAAPKEQGYEVEGRIPLASFESLGLPRPGPGVRIRCGLYRAEFSHDRTSQPAEQGDISHPPDRKPDGPPPTEDWMSWIDPGTEEPDFHVPTSLGWLEIAK